MNWLDIVIIVVAVITGIMGLKAGVIKTVALVVGLVAGIWLAGSYGTQVASVFGDAAWAEIAGYIIVLIVVLVVFSIVGSALKKALKLVMLGWVDKLVGGVLGVALGGFICASIITIVINATFTPPAIPGVSIPDLNFLNQAIRDSTVAKLLIEQLPVVLALIPGEVGDTVRDFFP